MIGLEQLVSNVRATHQVLMLQLFNVWVEPLVEVQVQQASNKESVIIEVCLPALSVPYMPHTNTTLEHKQ